MSLYLKSVTLQLLGSIDRSHAAAVSMSILIRCPSLIVGGDPPPPWSWMVHPLPPSVNYYSTTAQLWWPKGSKGWNNSVRKIKNALFSERLTLTDTSKMSNFKLWETENNLFFFSYLLFVFKLKISRFIVSINDENE